MVENGPEQIKVPKKPSVGKDARTLEEAQVKVTYAAVDGMVQMANQSLQKRESPYRARSTTIAFSEFLKLKVNR